MSSASTPSPSRLGLLRDHRDFRRLFAATALGQLGDRVLFLALPLVAVEALHAGALRTGLLSTATMAGSLLVGLPAGAWVDRRRKRTVLIGADLVRALTLLTVPVAWGTGTLTMGLLYAVALVHGLLTVLFDVAYVSWLPHLVGRRNLVEANARLSAVRSATSIGGPALAGPLVGWCGAPLALLASSAGMALSGLLATAIRGREEKPGPGEEQRRRFGREIAEGLAFVLRSPVLRATMATDAVFNVFLALYQAMLMIFLARQLGLSSFGIGLLLSGMGCGGLLGALVAGRVAARVGPGRVIGLAPLLTCPSAALLPWARPGHWTLYAAGAGLALLSLGGVVRLVAQASLQQTATPDALLGRMSATARFLSWGGLALGALAGGATGAAIGTAPTLWLGATGMTLSGLPALLGPVRADARRKSLLNTFN
ncbi:MFS transporter [Streptomyces sp. NPDC127190]|uniref:MFS transporter n=1 Tax=unclassified Streptomyces TaxID=2593676 RepID=UPI00362A6A32